MDTSWDIYCNVTPTEETRHAQGFFDVWILGGEEEDSELVVVKELVEGKRRPPEF